MKRATQILLVGAVCGLAAWLSESPVEAQFRVNPYQAYAQAQIAQQNWYGRQLMASQAGKVYGANYGIPFYASTVANYYAPYTTPYYPPVYTPPVYNPGPYSGAYTNPYSPVAPGYGTNPYTPGDPNVANPYTPYSPYYPYYPPYGGGYGYGAGNYLMGQADVMRAFGQQANSIEQARIVREQAKQAQIDTKWKQFEYEMKVKAATPTFTQEQERIGKITLQRIQKFSTAGEIVGGKALNYLLDDLRKFPGKKLSSDPINISSDLLLRHNVTKGNYGIGLLRDGGKVTFPTALQDAKGRADLEKQLVSLVKTAQNNGKTNAILTDVRSGIDSMREDLVKRVNETQTSQYIDGKQF
jgi:hypothetical protein